MNDEEFNRLNNPSLDLNEEKEKLREDLRTAYFNIVDVLKEYLDLKEEQYNIIALWIIGTYFHDQFPSYPFLFFNAVKGSGKTRTLNLIISLAKDGDIMLRPTEAVLFRTRGTLGIDELEGIGVTKEGMESIRELLNASYKKGSKVIRMKQKRTMDGLEHVPEEFPVYRPIVMANIWGMDIVLGDRCIQLILEKSSKKNIVNLVEIFREESIVIETKKILNQCSLCRCSFSGNVYKEWNEYVKNNYINYTNNINNINNINYTQTFKSINLMGLSGRDIELSLPLCLIASEISDENQDILKITTLTLKSIFEEKKSEEILENRDVSLIDFLSQELDENRFKTIKKVTDEFRDFLVTPEDWINSKWMGRALKRMNLIKAKRRTGQGVEVILDLKKAQEKIKIYK